MAGIRCYECDDIIDSSNESLEHIILNSIGGRLKSKEILCSGCNGNEKSKSDEKFFKILVPFVNLINVARDRGKVPNIPNVVDPETGTEYYLKPGGKPVYAKPEIKVEKVDGKELHQARFRTLKEAKQYLKSIRKKHKDKISEEEFKKLEDSLEAQSFKIDKPLKVSIDIKDTEVIIREMVRSLISFYIYSGGESKYIKEILKVAKGDVRSNGFAVFYLPRQDVFKKTDKQITHNLLVIGDKKEKVLYGYVELFSVFQIVSVLNLNYEGPDITGSYSYDLIGKEKVELDTCLSLNKSKLKKLVECQKSHSEDYKLKIERFLKIALDKQWVENRSEKLVSDVLEKVKSQFTEDELENPSDEVRNRFASLFAHEAALNLLPEIKAAHDKKLKAINRKKKKDN